MIQEVIEKIERKYTHKQIEIIKPKIVCALGADSGQILLRNKSTLSKLRGKVYDYRGTKLIVTYHPAALLKNSNWKLSARKDFELIHREYKIQ